METQRGRRRILINGDTEGSKTNADMLDGDKGSGTNADMLDGDIESRTNADMLDGDIESRTNADMLDGDIEPGRLLISWTETQIRFKDEC